MIETYEFSTVRDFLSASSPSIGDLPRVTLTQTFGFLKNSQSFCTCSLYAMSIGFFSRSSNGFPRFSLWMILSSVPLIMIVRKWCSSLRWCLTTFPTAIITSVAWNHLDTICEGNRGSSRKDTKKADIGLYGCSYWPYRLHRRNS